jgi:hypothetical protein
MAYGRAGGVARRAREQLRRPPPLAPRARASALPSPGTAAPNAVRTVPTVGTPSGERPKPPPEPPNRMVSGAQSLF